ncbi:MAG: Uma2 family endonuclease [Bacteroidota bacterium]
MPIQVNKRLISVSDYHKMGEVGILSESGLELIKGEIIQMSPIGSQHAAMVEKLKDILIFQLHGKALVRSQNPIILSNFTEAEPDICVVSKREGYYAGGHPSPKDIYLLVEMADYSLAYDREIKLPIYAEAGIKEVWIFNLVDKHVEVYTSPSNGQYTHHFTVSSGELKLQQPAVLIELASFF